MLVAQPPAPITARRGMLTKFSPVASSLSDAPGDVQNIGGKNPIAGTADFTYLLLSALFPWQRRYPEKQEHDT
jgi:hypothetical protein